MPGMATRDGRPWMCFGVMGEYYQPMGQTWVLTNVLEYGMDIQEALDFPRAAPHLGEVEVERGVSPAMREKLTALGHTLTEVVRPLGGGQAIMIDTRARRSHRRLRPAQRRRSARLLTPPS